MFDERLEATEIETGESRIFVRRGGAGPPVLLLHGFPQTHLMWRGVAPLLARRFAVVCADLPGYGRSGSSPRPPTRSSTPGTSSPRSAPEATAGTLERFLAPAR
ncbi:MAG TPA: alpha/beta fold hydrolase [Thermodesulfobacteriota bacterium]